MDHDPQDIDYVCRLREDLKTKLAKGEVWICMECGLVFPLHDTSKCGPVYRAKGPMTRAETPHGGKGLPPGKYYVGVLHGPDNQPLVHGPIVEH